MFGSVPFELIILAGIVWALFRFRPIRISHFGDRPIRDGLALFAVVTAIFICIALFAISVTRLIPES